MSKELTTIIEGSLLPQTQAELLLQNFTEFFENAKTYESQARAIVVDNEDDKVGMQNARELRLKLQKIRTGAENKRKELKEQSLREGKAIDGIANVIKALIVPIEEHLEKQEKFAEIAAENRKVLMVQERANLLAPFVSDITLYPIGAMTEDGFNELLESSKLAKQAQIEAEKKAEADRVAKLEADRLEQERIREENATLRAEQDALNKKAAEDKLIAQQEQQKAVEEERAKQEAIRKEEAEKAKQEAERKVQEEKDRREATLDSVVDLILACNEDREAIKEVIRKYVN